MMKDDKIVKLIGNGLRKARKSRGLKQTDLIGDSMSIGSLSGIENGKQDIPASVLYSYLKKMGLTFSEFWHLANNYASDDFLKKWIKVERWVVNGNSSALAMFLQDERQKVKLNPGNKYTRLNYLMLKNFAATVDPSYALSSSSKNEISQHLMSINDWTKYDLVLFGNTINCFSPARIKELSDDLLTRTSLHKSIPENKKMIVLILISAISELLDFNELSTVLKLQMHAKSLLEDVDIYEKSIFLFASGVIEVYRGNTQEGKRIMEDVIDIFNRVESYDLARTYQEDLNKIIKKFEIE